MTLTWCNNDFFFFKFPSSLDRERSISKGILVFSNALYNKINKVKNKKKTTKNKQKKTKKLNNKEITIIIK